MYVRCTESKSSCFEVGGIYTVDHLTGDELNTNTLKTTSATRGAIGIATRVDTLPVSLVRNRSRVLLSGEALDNHKCDLYHNVYEMALFRQCHFVIYKPRKDGGEARR